MRPSFAIAGAGMGGLAVAATLRQAGFDAQVYGQAHRDGCDAWNMTLIADAPEVSSDGAIR